MLTVRSRYYYEGLSTDTKPTSASTPNGAAFVEIDTGSGFLYDKESKTWYELPSGGSVIIDPASGKEF